jgi:glycogenin glucosyltransferase
MSEDHNLFQAPRSYPEPPKNMWYEVPNTPRATERPKPLFPWEQNQAPPTRVFPQEPISPEAELDLANSPPSESPPQESVPGLSVTTGGTSTRSFDSPSTPTIHVTTHEPFSSYTRTNAWDDVPEIQRYVENMQAARKGKGQGFSTPSAAASPVLERRRPSMKLTDFPTQDERPSLPVTPAPRQRPTFWGSERDDAGQLPAAEGVPPQQDWDPLKKLEELQRRQSEVLETGPLGTTKDLPTRQLPASAPLQPSHNEPDVSHDSFNDTTDGTSEDRATAGLSFSPVNFDTDRTREGADEGVFSPTQV